MKLRLYLLAGILSLATTLRAQEPVAWTYTAKQLGPLLYEVHLTANIQAGWHIYAQHQPKEAIAVPTAIVYTHNPLVGIQGQAKEEGKLVHFKNDEIGIAQDQYAGKVDFVQLVKLKAAVKTRIQGTLTWQACTDEQCLPAAHEAFSIDLPPEEATK